MSRVTDNLRATFISPEVLGLLLPVFIWIYWPEPFQLMAGKLSADLKWGFSLVAVPVASLSACFKLGSSLLSPQGKRAPLLQWPDYRMLKNRVIAALVFCAFAIVLSLLGFYMLADKISSLGVVMAFSACLSASAALATVALAWWRSREILGE